MTDLIAGDDWQLNFTVLKPDGTPFDLSGAPNVMWTLLDKHNEQVITSDEVSVTITDALNGKLSVRVPAAETTHCASNFYSHALRIVSGGVTATPFTGSMNVIADPWVAIAASRLVELRTIEHKQPSMLTKAGSPLSDSARRLVGR
jgi:hypothetical protein